MDKLTKQEVEKRTQYNKAMFWLVVGSTGLCCAWVAAGWLYDLVIANV